jgi:hypothetical protein
MRRQPPPALVGRMMVAAAGVLAVAWAAAGACRDPAADNFGGAAADGRRAGENRECRYSCERLAATSEA